MRSGEGEKGDGEERGCSRVGCVVTRGHRGRQTPLLPAVLPALGGKFQQGGGSGGTANGINL